MDVMKTLFLNPPSYDDFDGGAGSRYQATREVWSFWYPTWLAYPAGMIPGARLLDAPPHNSTVEMAEGRDWSTIGGISFQKNGAISHNPDRANLTDEELDQLPFVTEVYE